MAAAKKLPPWLAKGEKKESKTSEKMEPMKMRKMEMNMGIEKRKAGKKAGKKC